MRNARHDVRFHDGRRINHNLTPDNRNYHTKGTYPEAFGEPDVEMASHSHVPGVLGHNFYLIQIGERI